MRFELLGPVNVVVGGRRHHLPRAQTRGVLVALLLNAGHRMSRDAVIEAIWNGAPPSTARAQLHNAIRDIRAQLAALDGRQVILTEAFGYRAAVDPSTVDALTFEAAVRDGVDAARRGDDDTATRLLRGALDQWTGEPLQQVSGAFVEPARARLTDLRLTAAEQLADVDLRSARAGEAAAAVAALVHAYPMRERLRVRLVLALHHSGRSADALRSAREYRALLADQEGLDPGPELVEAETVVRRAQTPAVVAGPANGSAAVGASRGGSAGIGPAQLPPAPGGFTGRADEMVLLDGFAVARRATAGPIVAIVGPGGSGKTALAVHWAYRHLDDFPDGQLYVNLRGFGIDAPMDPFAALGQLLRGLGRAGTALPGTLDERAAEYRSLLSGRRLLVVLDNAADSTQVRPLLPGVGTHLTLVTSRRRLDGIAVDEGVAPMTLRPLPTGDAIALLRRHIPDHPAGDRVFGEIARVTDGLPLALRIVAARLAQTPPGAVAALVADLSDEQHRLSALALPAEETAVRSAFAASYQALSGAGGEMFRMLGLSPSNETGVPACAAALDLTTGAAAAALEELRAGHLVWGAPGGRYQMHDLVRLYARELADRDADPAWRTGTEARLLGWYASVADRADEVVRPHRGDLLTGPNTDETSFADATEALNWFDAEAGNLLPAVAAAEHRHPDTCWRLAAVLFGWLERRLTSNAWLAVYESGSRAAEAVGNRQAEAIMAQSLAIANCFLERFDTAAAAFGRALAIRRELGQHRQAGTTLMNLGSVYVETGRDAEGLACLSEALDIFKAMPGAEVLVSAAYNNLGWAHRQAGRLDEAVGCYARAVELAHDSGDAQSVAYGESNIGLALADDGRHAEASTHWTDAVTYARRAGDLRLERSALVGAGRARIRTGHLDTARDDLTAALALFEDLGEGDIAEVHALLAQTAR